VNPSLRKLYVVELRRQWSLLLPIVPVALGGIVYLISAPWNPMRPTFDVVRTTYIASTTFLVPMLIPLFFTGMVASDVKDGWLRTLLIRPVSRQQYLTMRMLAALTAGLAGTFIAGAIPVEIAAHVSGKPIVRDWVLLLEVYGMVVCQAILLGGILAFLSCWLPGVGNVVILFLWYTTASLLAEYLQVKFWSNKWLTVAGEFIFPHGFVNAGSAIVSGAPFPWEHLLWGLASASAFLSLAYWSVNRIEVDKGAD